MKYAMVVAYSSEDEGFIATVRSFRMFRVRRDGGRSDPGSEGRRFALAFRRKEG
jgi:hypothetical protein